VSFVILENDLGNLTEHPRKRRRGQQIGIAKTGQPA
jgi:hypothetical protein